MSGSGVVYKQSQITTMESAIDQAESDLASQNYSAVISDLTIILFYTNLYTGHPDSYAWVRTIGFGRA